MLLVVLIAAPGPLLAGCEGIGFLAGIFKNDAIRYKKVEARYEGLSDRRVAVMVAADDYALFRFPQSTLRVSQAVSQELADHLTGVRLSVPTQLDAFQKRNPYWTTRRYSTLMQELGVDRLIVVDLNEYRTNEPGNEAVWQGVVDGYVSVYEADAADPDNRVFEQQVRSEWPDASRFGEVNGTDEAVEAGMLNVFAREVSWLFYDHKEPQE